MNKSINRRAFIGKAAAGTAAFTLIPRHVLGGKSFTSANDKINLGYIGVGKQSYTLLRNINKTGETVVVAASDVFGNKLDDFIKAANEDNRSHGNNVDVKGYKYYRELLERDDIDAVVIASPDHWHGQMVVDAAKAGKDIYCEKPLALTVAEGRAMVNATRKYDRVFQTGNMQRSWRDFRHAVELVRNGYIGEITEANVSVGPPVKQCPLPVEEVPESLDWNEWVGPSLYRGYTSVFAPKDARNSGFPMWRLYRNFGGGMVTDWGAHMFDIVQWGLDKDNSGPVQFIPPEVPADSGIKMKYKSGVNLHHKHWGDGNAVQFIGTDGRIEVSRRFLRTFPDENMATMELKESDERVYHSDNHYQDWIDAIRKRTKPVSDVETGHRTASLCNIANIAYELQKPLLWDPEEEKFLDKSDANLMLTRAFRGKWDFMDY